jgi:uncharacterized protein YndB with AHSA1/START domain
MIKKILLGLGAVIALILIVAAFQPGEFDVKRSLAIAAPAQALFEQVNDHRKFTAWNPWLKLDPNVKNTFSGPATGVGSVCAWEGNSEIGAGSSTIIESKPGELVRQRMDWKKPMEGTSTVDFTFQPEGGKTVVTWHMYGPNNYVGKVMCLFMNMDNMIGGQFEVGLASLKALAETPAAK